MQNRKKTEESIDFVSGYFEEGALMPREGWRRFLLTHRIGHMRRNIAAACIGAAILTATASIYYFTSSTHPQQQIKTERITTPSEPASAFEPMKMVKIEFADATLQEVVAEIEKIYGVKVGNVPREEMRLTISYEGNAYDVIETINELLETNLVIEKTPGQTK